MMDKKEYMKNWHKNNKEHEKQYRILNKDKINKTSKEWDKNNPKRRYNIISNHRKKFKQKTNARTIAELYIKIPIGMKCEICNINNAEHRHHEDYSKPKEVKLLCKECHYSLHRDK